MKERQLGYERATRVTSVIVSPRITGFNRLLPAPNEKPIRFEERGYGLPSLRDSDPMQSLPTYIGGSVSSSPLPKNRESPLGLRFTLLV